MKTREGYVSNSSSSSFIVCYNDISVFDEFKDKDNSRCHSILVSDLCEALRNMDKNDKNVKSCIEDEFITIMNDYRCALYWVKRDIEPTHPEHLDFQKNMEDECRLFNCDVDGMSSIIASIKSKIDRKTSMDYEEMKRYAHSFKESAFESMHQKWENMSIVNYGDDRYPYMEAVFIPKIVAPLSGDGFLVKYMRYS